MKIDEWFTYKPRYFKSVKVNNLFKWSAEVKGIVYILWATGLAEWSTLELTWQGKTKHFHYFKDVENFIDGI